MDCTRLAIGALLFLGPLFGLAMGYLAWGWKDGD